MDQQILCIFTVGALIWHVSRVGLQGRPRAETVVSRGTSRVWRIPPNSIWGAGAPNDGQLLCIFTVLKLTEPS